MADLQTLWIFTFGINHVTLMNFYCGEIDFISLIGFLIDQSSPNCPFGLHEIIGPKKKMFCFKWRTVLTLWTSPRKTVHFWMAGTSTFIHSWSFGPSTQDQKPIPMFIEQSAALNWPYQHSTLSKSSWHFDHTMALHKNFSKIFKFSSPFLATCRNKIFIR